MKKINKTETPSYYYSEHPKSCALDDFWGQVKRTVNGQPVDQHQIDLITQAIVSGLDLQDDDFLLDLCCGNGALSRLIFQQCRGGVGVDFSEYLIEIARRNFEKPGRETYIIKDVGEFVRNGDNKGKFFKVFCFGSFQYLPIKTSEDVLENLSTKFVALNRIFLGNIPDRSKMESFFQEHHYEKGIEDDPSSPIGLWWDQSTLEEFAMKKRWLVSFNTMPDDFYASHYRFNAILDRA